MAIQQKTREGLDRLYGGDHNGFPLPPRAAIRKEGLVLTIQLRPILIGNVKIERIVAAQTSAVGEGLALSRNGKRHRRLLVEIDTPLRAAHHL